MPLCAYQDRSARQDKTVIENAFLREYMPTASLECLKVYLYGLMQCQSGVGESTLSSFARALFLSEKQVRDAFSTLSELGLCAVEEQPAYSVSYLNIQNALPKEKGIYEYAEFNNTVQKLFAPRGVTATELNRIYDWVDVYGLSRDCIPLLIEYGRSKMQKVETKGVGAQLNYIDKIAQQWVDLSINTQEKAQRWIQEQGEWAEGLKRVLKGMGMNRQATAPERELYRKWREMGFDVEGILAGIGRLTGAYAPSFRRLDDVLSEFYRLGILTSQQIARQEKREQDCYEECKEALRAMGYKNPVPNATQLQAYESWKKAGVGQERILLACECCARDGEKGARYVEKRLEDWKNRGLKSNRAITKYEKERSQLDRDLRQAMEVLGSKKGRITDREREKYRSWMASGMDPDMLFYAAECAAGGENPYALLQYLMDQWQEKGIKSVKEAKQEQKKFAQQKPSARTAKGAAARQFEQRGDQPEGLFEHF